MPTNACDSAISWKHASVASDGRAPNTSMRTPCWPRRSMASAAFCRCPIRSPYVELRNIRMVYPLSFAQPGVLSAFIAWCHQPRLSCKADAAPKPEPDSYLGCRPARRTGEPRPIDWPPAKRDGSGPVATQGEDGNSPGEAELQEPRPSRVNEGSKVALLR